MNLTARRIHAFDALKAVVMIGVIAGHVLRYGLVVNKYQNSFPQPYLGNVMVYVSMPIFFMISGYFAAKKYIERVDVCSVFARIVCLLWPLFACGIIIAICFYFCGVKSAMECLMCPIWHVIGGGWFLRTLAICYLLVMLICLIAKNNLVRVFLLSFVCIILVFVPKSMWPIIYLDFKSVIHMLPYFAFGIFALPMLLDWIDKRCAVVITGVLFFTVVIFAGSVKENGMSFYRASLEYQDVFFSVKSLFCFFARPLVSITGTLFFIGIFKISESVWPKIVGRVGAFGTTTLGIYVFHEWPLIYIGKHISNAVLPCWSRWIIALLLFVFWHYIAVFIKRNWYLNWFFFFNEKKLYSFLIKCIPNKKSLITDSMIAKRP